MSNSLAWKFEEPEDTTTYIITPITDTVGIIILPVMAEERIWLPDTIDSLQNNGHWYSPIPDSFFVKPTYFDSIYSADTSIDYSIGRYFWDNSNGKYYIERVAVLTNGDSLWHSDTTQDIDLENAQSDIRKLVWKLLPTIDEDFDFGPFDIDCDSYVDMMYALGRVPLMSKGSNSLWLSGIYKTNDTNSCGDTVSIKKTMPWGCGYKKLEEMHIICHEFGHNPIGLGHPFNARSDPKYISVGSFDVMNYAPYADNIHGPWRYHDYMRMKLSWLDTIVINETKFNYRIISVDSSNIYKIRPYNEYQPLYCLSNPQYFILAHHRKIVWWELEWPDKGIFIYHIDPDFGDNKHPLHKEYDPECPSGLYSWRNDTTILESNDTIITLAFIAPCPDSGKDSLDDFYTQPLIKYKEEPGTWYFSHFDSFYKHPETAARWKLFKSRYGNETTLFTGNGLIFDIHSNPNSNLYSSLDSLTSQSICSHIGIRFKEIYQDSAVVDILLNQWSGILDSNSYAWNMSQYEITGDLTISDTCTLTTSDSTLIYFPYDEDDQCGGVDTTFPEIIVDGELVDSASWMFHNQVGFYFRELPAPGEDSIYVFKFYFPTISDSQASIIRIASIYNDSLGVWKDVPSTFISSPFGHGISTGYCVRLHPDWSDSFDASGIEFQMLPMKLDTPIVSDSVKITNIALEKISIEDFDTMTIFTQIDPFAKIYPHLPIRLQPPPKPLFHIPYTMDTAKFALRVENNGSKEYFDRILFRAIDRSVFQISISDQNENYFILSPDSSAVPYFAKNSGGTTITDEISDDDYKIYSNSKDYIEMNFDLTDYSDIDTVIVEVDAILLDQDAELRLEIYNPKLEDWESIGYFIPRVFRAKDYLSFVPDETDTIKARLYWTTSYTIDCVRLYPKPLSVTPEEISLDSAYHSCGKCVTKNLELLDGDVIDIGDGQYIDLYFGSGSNIDTGYVRDIFIYFDADKTPTDSLWAEVDTSTDTIEVVRRGTETAVKDAWVCIDNGDTGCCGYTNSDGKYKPSLDLDYTYDIYISKDGFRPLKVQHLDSLYGNEVWCNDVELLGDAFVYSGDTLTILPGTQVRAVPNTDASSQSGDFNNGRTEIVAYGGHVEIDGTSDDKVILAPGPGGSTNFRWEGVYCRNGGSADIDHADFKYSYMALQGYNQPGQMEIKNSRIELQGMIYANYANVDSVNKVFHAESCYVGNRIQIFYGGNLCTVYACTLDGEYYEGVTIQSSESGIPVFEDCYIEGDNYRCVRARSYGKVKFIDCIFDGSELSSGNYVFLSYDNAELYLDTCTVDVAGKSKGVYSGYSSAFTKSRYTTIDNYDYGVHVCDSSDFGELDDPGHNCFLDDNGYAIYNSGNYTIQAQWNYFDTLLFEGNVTYDSTDSECEPDSSLSKRVVRSEKPVLPSVYSLGPAVPNPFNSTVQISFQIPRKSDIKLEVFDILGRLVQTILSTEIEAGTYTAIWDGKDDDGKNLPSGVYLYRLRCEEFEDTKKMTLIR